MRACGALNRILPATLMAAACGLSFVPGAVAQSVETDIVTIRGIGGEGKGAPAAGQALKSLANADAAAIPTILKAFDDKNPLAMNYLRSAVESIADRTVRAGGTLPVDALIAFVEDRHQNSRARSLAFEWLGKVEKEKAAELVPAMISDPSPELRRISVQRLIDLAAKTQDDAEAVKLNEEALTGAVDDDQVKVIVEKLKKSGKTVDLQKHFGFLPKWSYIGPFDNHELKGFAAVYPPETGVDLKATYQGQLGEVKWTEIATTDEYGILDIAKQVKPYKGAVIYLATEFVSDKPRAVEVRLGTPNAWKLWLNGKPLFAREEYHRGMAIDQYRVPVQLKSGSNVILVKLCQNEQEQDWAQRYQLQLRVSDAAGSAVHASAAETSQK